MYNCFNQMIDSIFKNENFYEYCYVNGIKCKCIASTFSTGMMFTDAGMEDTTNFYLDLHISELDTQPKINDRIEFRKKVYKIAHIDNNSVDNVARIYLTAVSKGK